MTLLPPLILIYLVFGSAAVNVTLGAVWAIGGAIGISLVTGKQRCSNLHPGQCCRPREMPPIPTGEIAYSHAGDFTDLGVFDIAAF